MRKVILIGLALCLLGAAALPAHAGEVLLLASGTSLPKDFSCGDAKPFTAGKYDLEVTYDTQPSARSTLRISKDGRTLCSVEGSGTSLHEKMASSKTRLFSRFDAERKATEIVVITPTGMRDQIRNQVFYLPERATP